MPHETCLEIATCWIIAHYFFLTCFFVDVTKYLYFFFKIKIRIYADVLNIRETSPYGDVEDMTRRHVGMCPLHHVTEYFLDMALNPM
jgi:hypothetical protein